MDRNQDTAYLPGFSSLTKKKKIEWLAKRSGIPVEQFEKFSCTIEGIGLIYDSLSENTVAHFSLPFGIAPGFRINGRDYILPLVTEESSVVAALARAAKIWYTRGGFNAVVTGTVKKGQIHFFWSGGITQLNPVFPVLKKKLMAGIHPITENMERRGGGVLNVTLIDNTDKLGNYYQLDVDFGTGEAMGANFINSVLEKMAEITRTFMVSEFPYITPPEINMAILSNYTPDCIAEARVECPVNRLENIVKGMSAKEFADRFEKAVRIAKVNLSRAVTHNKGIFNGIDSLALATGNDWRALESAGHAYAVRDGEYRGLTNIDISNGMFRFYIKLPVNIGTTGGVTTVHPLAGIALKIMDNPSVNELMQLFAVAGLAANFSAITALIGQGIQAGHMKLHLQNILIQLNASDSQKQKAKEYFRNKKITYSDVSEFLKKTP